MASTVKQVLAEHSTARYFIEYMGFRSNHLAHGVIALDRLGASSERLNRFIHWYKPRLETPDNDIHVANEDISAVRGKRVAYYSLVSHYETLYRDKYKDLTALVAGEFPQLSLGVAGSAVHGLIHLGYGYAARNERVVIEGLAYLHHSYLPVVSSVEGSLGAGGTDILDLLAAVARDVELREAMEVGMDKAAYTALKVGVFQRKVAYLLTEHGDMLVQGALSAKLPAHVVAADGAIDVGELGRVLVKWAIVVYTRSQLQNDFFLLHGVTAAWAMQQLVPALDREVALLACRHFLAVLVAVYIARGAPPLTVDIATDRGEGGDQWKALLERTMAGDRDEHCFKLVQVCYEMAKEDTEDAALYTQASESVLENTFIV